MPSFTVPRDTLNKPTFAGNPPDGNYTALVTDAMVRDSQKSDWRAVSLTLEAFQTPEGASEVQNGTGMIDLTNVKRNFSITAEGSNANLRFDISAEQVAKAQAALGLGNDAGDVEVAWETADDLVEQFRPGFGTRVGVYMKKKGEYQEVTSVYPIG